MNRTNRWLLHRGVCAVLPYLLGCALAGCGGAREPAAEGRPAARKTDPPNIIWVVWDTCRRDHLSVYGYERQTTPFLEQWSRGARVYTNCVSAGSTTVPAHASMFTGLLAPEHGAHNRYPQLQQRFETIAERLQQAGYGTYLFSCNPHISAENGFTQGFATHEHPWSPHLRDAALDLLAEKVDPRDRSYNLNAQLHAGRIKQWPLSQTGEMIAGNLRQWLHTQPADRPTFVFLNYMEAHGPLIPPAKYRELFMTPEQVEHSFRVLRTFPKVWSYVFGLEDYTPEEIDLTRRTYDAALRELDDMFRDLIQTLDAAGRLDNTAIVFTSDHGELLGEHHMLDHQFAVYNELLYVPLIVHYPPEFEAGRDERPVMNFDLFVTLLDLAGVSLPQGLETRAVDLRTPDARRPRLAVYPHWPDWTFLRARSRHPRFDHTAFERALWAFYDEPYKFVWSSDGRHEMYDVASDPREQKNLYESRPDLAGDLCARLSAYAAGLNVMQQRESLAGRSDEALQQLRTLGYAGGDTGAEDEDVLLPTCDDADAETEP